jgi:hypothetical protein
MKTMINRTVLIFMLAISSQFSQAQSIKRVEIPVPANSTEVFTIPLNQQGVIVLNQINKLHLNPIRHKSGKTLDGKRYNGCQFRLCETFL